MRSQRRIAQVAVLMTVACANTFATGGLYRSNWLGRTAGYSMIGVTFGAIVLWAVLGRDGHQTRLLRWRQLRELGKICYGVYLLQRPVQVAVGKIAGAVGLPWDPAGLHTVPLLILATVAVASVSWTFFERPVLSLKRRFAASGHPGDEPVPRLVS